MDAPGEGQERRLPPIQIPPGYMWQPKAPGPNAFAIAERAAKAKQDVQGKLDQAERLHEQSHRPAIGHGEQNAYTDQGPISPGLRPKEAYSDLAGGVLKSPKKAGFPYAPSSTSSQYTSASQSNVVPEGRSMPSLQRQFGGLGGEKTARAAIEERREQKYLDMMGQDASSTQVYDYRPGRHLNQDSDHHEVSSKSPRKKVFGVSIPFTSRSAPKVSPPPPMKAKAAQVMGVPLPPRNKKFDVVANMVAGFSAPRSETSKSLPAKIFNKADHHAHRRSPPNEARRSPKGDRSPPLSRARRRTPPRHPTIFSHQETLDALTGADQRDVPPIPPRKDSLPAAAMKLPAVAAEDMSSAAPKKVTAHAPENTKKSDGDPLIMKLLSPPTPVLEPEDFTDNGMQMRPPSVPRPTSSLYEQPGESPKKPCPLNVINKATLVQGPQIHSARAAVEFAYPNDNELSPGLASPTTMFKDTFSYLRSGRRSAPVSPTTPWPTGGFMDNAQSNNNAPQLDSLQSTAYVSPMAAARQTFDDSPTLPPAAFDPVPEVVVNKPVDPTVHVPPKPAVRGSADLQTLLHPTVYAPLKAPLPKKVVPSNVLKSKMYVAPEAAVPGHQVSAPDKSTPQVEHGGIPTTSQGNVKDTDAQPEEAKETGRADEAPRYSPHHVYRQRVGDSDHIARVMASLRFQPPGTASGSVQNTEGGDVQKPKEEDVRKPVKDDVQKSEKEDVQKSEKEDDQKFEKDNVQKGDIQKPVKVDVQKPAQGGIPKPVKSDYRKISSGSPAPKPVPSNLQKPSSGGIQTGNPSTRPNPMLSSVGSSKANTALSPWPKPGTKPPASARPYQPPPFDYMPVAADAPISEYFALVNQHLDLVTLSIMENVNQKTNLAAQAMALKQDQMQADIEQSLNQLKSLVNLAGHRSHATEKQLHDIGTKLDNFGHFIETEFVEPFAKQTQKMNDLEQSMKALEKTVKDLQTSAPQRSSVSSNFPSPQLQGHYFPDPHSRPTLPSFFDHIAPARPAMQPAASSSANLMRFASHTQLDRPPIGRESRENNGLPFAPTPVEAYRNPALAAPGGYPQQSYNYSQMHDPSQQYGYNPGSQQ